MKAYQNAEELIGNTPLVCLKNIKRRLGLHADIYAKIEKNNVGGSIKDRVAKYMLDEAERTGALTAGGTVIEPTSGNTGIGLALLCAARGYRAVIVMPETMSVERQKLIKAYGAEVVLTDGAKGMQGAVEKAEEIRRNTRNSIIAGQFDNPANPKAHYETTAPEIDGALGGRVDAFVACVGTGGTLTGVGRYFKERNTSVKVYAVEPAKSPLLSGGKAGAHGIQGIGANFIPANFDRSVCDDVIRVTDEEAFAYARLVSEVEGLFVGISSGAALAAAVRVAGQVENKGKNVVTVFPDGGERYLSVW